MLISILCVLVVLTSCVSIPPQPPEEDRYQIHDIGDNWKYVRVVPPSTYLGDFFYEALKELEVNYTIEDIVPINAKYGYGSHTKGLFVKVKEAQ